MLSANQVLLHRVPEADCTEISTARVDGHDIDERTVDYLFLLTVDDNEVPLLPASVPGYPYLLQFVHIQMLLSLHRQFKIQTYDNEHGLHGFRQGQIQEVPFRPDGRLGEDDLILLDAMVLEPGRGRSPLVLMGVLLVIRRSPEVGFPILFQHPEYLLVDMGMHVHLMPVVSEETIHLHIGHEPIYPALVIGYVIEFGRVERKLFYHCQLCDTETHVQFAG